MSYTSKIRMLIGLLAIAIIGAAAWFASMGPSESASTEVSEVEEEDSGMIAPVMLADDAPVDYNFHVKPILSNNCFACHGFDPNTRESGLRLDTREGATTNYAAEGDTPMFAVVPGSPEQSEIWRRINHTNPDLRMPPIESHHDALNEEERSIIRRWIEQGAEYKTHWSFIPPEKPEIPEVEQADWPKNNIDHFILAKLETLDTGPSAEADKETLIRRVTLDLTGLPPTPEEIDAFLADESPFAYEMVVDRLLESPHYAERMALDWMDVSRYGDTNAHHVDLIRTSWPWRDWVIRAFNENKPYDEFIVEQLAGDLLENPTRQQILATSFNRNHPITNEGGAINEEYLAEYAHDRVHTVSTAFLGMTMACARCHDHKYDPFTIDEYYSFFSFFNSIDEKGLETQNAKDAEGYKPFIYLAANPAEQKELDAYSERLSAIVPKMTQDEILDKLKARFEEEPINWTRIDPLSSRKALWNGKLVGGPRPRSVLAALTPDQQQQAFEESGKLSFDLSLEKAPEGQNLILLHLTSLKFNESGDHRNLKTMDASAKVTEIRLHLVSGDQKDASMEAPVELVEFWSNDLLFDKTRPINLAFDGDSETYWEQVPSDRPMMLLLRLQEPLPAKTKDQRLRLEIEYAEEGLPLVQNNATFVYAAKSEQTFDELAEVTAPFSLTALVNRGDRHYAYKEQFKLEWAISEGELEPQSLGQWAGITDRLYDLNDSSVRVAVMQEKKEPTPTFVLNRGAYDAPLEDRPVDRIVPAALGELDSDYPKNRLGLAYWLIDEDNPLTSRVTVNRYWQVIFGNGLVRTSEDLGFQGELPTHPELLDYLAIDFIESGWDVKALMRQLVTSATYRQQSVRRREFDLADPENRLLAWFPRKRLPAEFIRDNALAASGLLVPKIGGPSVKPYQPDGLWREKTMRPDSNTGTFRRDEGEDLYRRGMYTFWKQVAPPPQMEAFDAPSREVCVTKRTTTNTPMQALVLLNDETYLEASRAMATRLMNELPGEWEATLSDRLVRGYRYLTGRHPSESGLKTLKNLTQESFAVFSADTEKAEGFLSYGESPLDPSKDKIELATLAYTASAILNLDKTITRD